MNKITQVAVMTLLLAFPQMSVHAQSNNSDNLIPPGPSFDLFVPPQAPPPPPLPPPPPPPPPLPLPPPPVELPPLPPPPPPPPPPTPPAVPQAPEELIRVDLVIRFDTDKSKVQSEYNAKIQEIVDFMNKYPEASCEIEGHTDSESGDKYNQGLSERRANQVKADLVKRGINPARLSAKGYGEKRPISSNKTASGRQENRRVTITSTSVVRKP